MCNASTKSTGLRMFANDSVRRHGVWGGAQTNADPDSLERVKEAVVQMMQ